MVLLHQLFFGLEVFDHVGAEEIEQRDHLFLALAFLAGLQQFVKPAEQFLMLLIDQFVAHGQIGGPSHGGCHLHNSPFCAELGIQGQLSTSCGSKIKGKQRCSGVVAVLLP
jgi:hypothetical protein